MRERALWLASISLAACYFGPDKHREDDFTASEAGIGTSDATVMGGLDAELDGDLLADAGDAAEAGCATDLECPLALAPQCLNGACVPCSEQNDCARFADTPNCGPAGACVVCTAERTQLCSGATPACDPMTNACVQCVVDADCPSESQAACSPNHSCGGCTEDADCTRFSKVCDMRSAACVQCRPETEATDCKDGTACDPKLLTCTTRQRGSVETCNPCVSDSECVTDHRCIPMTFGPGKQDLGGFCLKRFSTGCVSPYFRIASRASLSGVTAERYCSVDEEVNSCPAVAAFAKTCTSDDSCGAPGARCESVNGHPNLCTYSCMDAPDCKSAAYACGGGGGDPYCGGP